MNSIQVHQIGFLFAQAAAVIGGRFRFLLFCCTVDHVDLRMSSTSSLIAILTTSLDLLSRLARNAHLVFLLDFKTALYAPESVSLVSHISKTQSYDMIISVATACLL